MNTLQRCQNKIRAMILVLFSRREWQTAGARGSLFSPLVRIRSQNRAPSPRRGRAFGGGFNRVRRLLSGDVSSISSCFEHARCGQVGLTLIDSRGTEGRLRPRFVVGFNGLSDTQAELAEFQAEGLASDSEEAGGLMLAPAAIFEDGA